MNTVLATLSSRIRFPQLRLLRIVIALGLSLLAVKGFGLVHAAQATGGAGTSPPAQTDPISDAKALASNTDPASDDSELGSAAEIDVLTSLTKRRKQLDAREQQLAMRENVITAAEQRVDGKIAQLQALQAAIQKLMTQQDTEQQKQIGSLVKTYSAMKPKDAARIFNALDEDVLLSVAALMKSDVLAPVLAAMEPANAQKLTVRLANRLKVVPPPAPVVPPPAAPVPDNQSAAATAPAETSQTLASLAPATTPTPPPAAATPPAATPAVSVPPASHSPAAPPAKAKPRHVARAKVERKAAKIATQALVAASHTAAPPAVKPAAAPQAAAVIAKPAAAPPPSPPSQPVSQAAATPAPAVATKAPGPLVPAPQAPASTAPAAAKAGG